MKPVINPLFPVEGIASIDELMAIATGMEHEAASRYEHLAESMARQDEAALAETFRRLAELERAHEEGLGRWAEREGRARPVPASFAWRLPETFGAEADGAEAHTLTPYRALSIAVDNEERAFTFYTYCAAMAEDPAIRARAEGLAREELAHVHQLRMLRRQAFHAGRTGPPRARPRDLAALAAGIEGASAELDAAMAATLAETGPPEAASLLGGQAEAARRRAARFAGFPAGPGTNVAEGARAAGLLRPGQLNAEGALRLSLRNAEEAAEVYMAAAEQASDEAVVTQAQDLAGQAVARLAVVRSLLHDA